MKTIRKVDREPNDTALGEFAGVIPIFLLISSFFYILFIILNPKHSWVQPEAYYYKSYIINYIGLDYRDVVRQTFNFEVFEWSNRVTRPLSSTFEILDTHFRAWLWRFIAPLPSLSLTFLFTLVLCPAIFYKFLRNVGIRPGVALVATAYMLLHPGSLSLVAMLFRPAKAMINFGLVLGLLLASEISRRNKSDQLSVRGPSSALLSLWGLLFLGFLFDETACVIVLAITTFFPRTFFQDRRRALTFLSIPVILLGLYKWVFPAVAVAFGFPKPDLFQYEVISSPPIPGLSRNLKNILINIYIVIKESFCLFNPMSYPSAWERGLALTFFIWAPSPSRAQASYRTSPLDRRRVPGENAVPSDPRTRPRPVRLPLPHPQPRRRQARGPGLGTLLVRIILRRRLRHPRRLRRRDGGVLALEVVLPELPRGRVDDVPRLDD